MKKRSKPIREYRIFGSSKDGLIKAIEQGERVKIFSTVYCERLTIMETLGCCSFNWFKTAYKDR